MLDWYLQEHHALADLFKSKFPKIKFLDFKSSDLNDLEKFEQLVNEIEPTLKVQKSIVQMKNVKSNLNPHLVKTNYCRIAR